MTKRERETMLEAKTVMRKNISWSSPMDLSRREKSQREIIERLF